MHHHDLLGRGQLGLQVMRCVRAVHKDLSLFPLVDRLLGNALAVGQDASSLSAGSDLCAQGSVVRAFLCSAIIMRTGSR